MQVLYRLSYVGLTLRIVAPHGRLAHACQGWPDIRCYRQRRHEPWQ
jgi:hypothetical protein